MSVLEDTEFGSCTEDVIILYFVGLIANGDTQLRSVGVLL